MSHIPAQQRTITQGQEGSSLVEVLAAMLILLFVMLSTLQLFTMAVSVDRVADAQTEMSESAQTVVEVIRTIKAIDRASAATPLLPLTSGSTVTIAPGDALWDDFRVIDSSARYNLSYIAADNGTEWEITVTAAPSQSGQRTYLMGSNYNKGVQYVARIPK